MLWSRVFSTVNSTRPDLAPAPSGTANRTWFAVRQLSETGKEKRRSRVADGTLPPPPPNRLRVARPHSPSFRPWFPPLSGPGSHSPSFRPGTPLPLVPLLFVSRGPKPWHGRQVSAGRVYCPNNVLVESLKLLQHASKRVPTLCFPPR